MKVAIGSAFRYSARRLDRYFGQVWRLRDALWARGHGLQLVLVWGDCDDGTAQGLRRYAEASGCAWQVVERSHGGPVFGSTEHADRMAALSYVGDGILEGVPPDADRVFYVESDLLWEPQVPLALLDGLDRDGVWDVLCPLVHAGPHFYDVWGTRGLDGARFAPFHPYHSSLRFDGPTEVGSCGSCLMLRGEVARAARMRGGCLVGFCAHARELGYRIAVDARLRVDHPC